MQEEVNQKTVVLAFQTARFTGNVLKKGIQMYLNHRKAKAASAEARIKAKEREPAHGKMTVEELVGQGQGATTIEIKDRYDYILIDCMPSLGKLTFNALYCADTVLIPVQAAYLPVKGLQLLMVTIANAKRWINPKLEIEGVLITMLDGRSSNARDIICKLRDAYNHFTSSPVYCIIQGKKIFPAGFGDSYYDPDL